MDRRPRRLDAHGRRSYRLLLACLAGLLAASMGRGVEAAPPGSAVALGDEQASPSVAAVMLAGADRELERDELGALRGGFLLSPGVAMRMVMEFRAQVNGGAELTLPIPTGFSGVLTGVRDGVPFVQGTNQFGGLISVVQNNLDFQRIDALTTLRFDLFGSMSAVRGGLLRSRLSFGTALQSR